MRRADADHFFELSGKMNDGHWSAELVPADELVKQSVSKVELSGDSLVRKIILHESSGDHTTIHFKNLNL